MANMLVNFPNNIRCYWRYTNDKSDFTTVQWKLKDGKKNS